MHRVRGQSADMEALVWAFDQRIDRSGKWKRPPNSVRHAMQGYSLLYLVQCTGERRYSAAADALAEMLKQHPRVARRQPALLQRIERSARRHAGDGLPVSGAPRADDRRSGQPPVGRAPVGTLHRVESR